MSEQTPSQAEGDRRPESPTDDESGTSRRREAPRTTPSQAEGDDLRRDDAVDNGEDGEKGKEGKEDSKAWRSGWSGP